MKTWFAVKKLCSGGKCFHLYCWWGADEKIINPFVLIITQTNAKVNKRMLRIHAVYCWAINILLSFHNRYWKNRWFMLSFPGREKRRVGAKSIITGRKRIAWGRIGTGVPPGLQNQLLGVRSVLGGFDSHTFPPKTSRPEMFYILGRCLFLLFTKAPHTIFCV